MAKYTLELRTILKDPNFNLWNFEYKFYDAEARANFEEKFEERYYFNEIGYETIGRFQQRLKWKLNEIAPYYEQIYQTELESRNIKFLLNKDLREEFIRELETDRGTVNESQNTSISNASTNTNSDSTSTNSETSTSKTSDMMNGLGDVGLSDGNLTAMGNNVNSNNSNNKDVSSATTNTNDSNNATSNTNTKGTDTEKTTLISQGNIGVTSSATLLKEWREVIINIDSMILDELRFLFMTIY